MSTATVDRTARDCCGYRKPPRHRHTKVCLGSSRSFQSTATLRREGVSFTVQTPYVHLERLARPLVPHYYVFPAETSALQGVVGCVAMARPQCLWIGDRGGGSAKSFHRSFVLFLLDIGTLCKPAVVHFLGVFFLTIGSSTAGRCETSTSLTVWVCRALFVAATGGARPQRQLAFSWAVECPRSAKADVILATSNVCSSYDVHRVQKHGPQEVHKGGGGTFHKERGCENKDTSDKKKRQEPIGKCR